MSYLVVLWLHLIGAALLFGTNEVQPQHDEIAHAAGCCSAPAWGSPSSRGSATGKGCAKATWA